MSSEDQNIDCPLCLEPLEMDDLSFFPCTCGYQICRFCWHRIRTDENGLCPACRKQYPEDPADFKPLTQEQLHRIKNEKRQKDIQRKQKISENRKHLANVRVVQKNLVFVVGLSQRLAEPEVLKKTEYFGKFGKVHKVVINHTTSYAGSQGPSASAYVTYHRSEDSLRAIQSVNNIVVDNRTLKASLGTTKYCSHFLKNQHCPKTDCMYLHELGDQAASFTKEEMQQGKHQEYEKRLHELLISSSERNKENRKQSSSPTGSQGLQSQQPSSSPPVTSKELWPTLQIGEPTVNAKSETKQNGRTSKNNPSSDSKENSDIIQRSRNMSGDEQTSNSYPRLYDRTSESSSQSSSASPIQENGQLDSWQSNSSPSPDSSETDHTNTVQPSMQPQTLPNDTSDSFSVIDSGSKIQRPNGYTQNFHNTLSNGSLHSNIPPRFLNHVPSLQQQQQQHRMSQMTASYPPGLLHDLNNASRTAKASPIVNKALMDNSNPNHSFFSTVNGLRNPAAPQPVPASTSADWHGNNLERSQLTNADTLPVSTTTDWQAAFGFGPSQKQQTCDDDLGFDPWNESTKGLADLIAKESKKQNSFKNDINGAMWGASYSIPPSHNTYTNSLASRRVCAPPGFSPNHINGYTITAPSRPPQNGEMNEHMLSELMNQRLMMNNRQQQHQQQHQFNVDPLRTNGGPVPPSSVPSDALHKHHMNGSSTSNYISADRFRNWQAELRAMLPNINISFGSQNNGTPSSSHDIVPQTQLSSLSQQQDIFKDRTDASSQWNYKSLHNPGIDDAAIVSNGVMSNGVTNKNFHHRLTLAAAQQYAYRMNNQQQQQQQQQQYPQWDMSSSPYSQHHMPPGFNAHLPQSHHHSEQQILGNLPGVL